jgi:hypothetical protein
MLPGSRSISRRVRFLRGLLRSDLSVADCLLNLLLQLLARDLRVLSLHRFRHGNFPCNG